MKTAKKILAMFLSALFIMGMMTCSVFADNASEDLILVDYNNNAATFKYGGVMCLGENNSFEAEENTAYYFTFVPKQTGVHSFDGTIRSITGDTEDNQCREDECEDRLTLYSEEQKGYSDYCFLTEGKTYYVLVDRFSGVSIAYEGTVTDVNPAIPLVDLVEDWDVFKVNGGFEYGRSLDLEMIVELSNNKTLSGWGFYFAQSQYTDNEVIWQHLGFEKTFRYNAISIKDMVSSVEAKNSVDFVKFFDGRIELQEPVTLVVHFSDGSTTEVVIEDYDSYYSFTGTNGRTYNIYLDIDDNGVLATWIAGSDFGSMQYSMARIGFFRDLVYYFRTVASIGKFFYTLFLRGADYNTKIQLVLDGLHAIGDVRTVFLKSQVSRFINK